MIIFNQRVFFTISGQFSRISGAPGHAFFACQSPTKKPQTPDSAQKRRFINPNKPEPPKRRKTPAVIGEREVFRGVVALWNCRECCFEVTIKRTGKMITLSVLGMVVFVGLAVVVRRVVLLDRARKEIEVVKFDTERL